MLYYGAYENSFAETGFVDTQGKDRGEITTILALGFCV